MSTTPEDDDKTVIRVASEPLQPATPRPEDSEAAQGLRIGTRFGEIEITDRIGEGGFSIVYLAWDHALDRKVALKEYMPATIAVRRGEAQVTVRSERHRASFEAGLRSFVNEAKLLAHFDHPSLVKVHRFWEANGTAYMVMPMYEGRTLRAQLGAMPNPPDEAWLKAMLEPLLDAVAALHAEHCYHRDIAPDNILLLGANGKPLLLDFGAARREIGDATHAFTVILKPGYAPVEQYAETASMKQGPWTDVYALCAVLYDAITGRPPVPSVGRMLKDELTPLADAARGRYSPAFLDAIDRGLAVRPENRFQDIASLRQALLGAGATSRGKARKPDRPGEADARGDRSAARSLIWPSLSLVVAVVAVGGALWWFNRPVPAVVATTRDGASPLVLAAPNVASAPLDDANTPISTQDTPSRRNGSTPAFALSAVFDDISKHADAAIEVRAAPVNERVVIGRDEIALRVRSSISGYLYVLYAGTGPSAMAMVFPNAKDVRNRISAGSELTVPSRAKLDATGPPGDDYLVAIVSRSPRDFSGIGFRRSADPKNPVGFFDLDALRNTWPPSSETGTPYAGVPSCKGDATCPPEFGVGLARITEVQESR